MVELRVVNGEGPFVHRGESYADGETFDADEWVADDFPYTLERTDESDADQSDAANESTTAPFDPGEHTVDELRDEIDGLSDDERQALADAERDGKDRSGAIDVLEA